VNDEAIPFADTPRTIMRFFSAVRLRPSYKITRRNRDRSKPGLFPRDTHPLRPCKRNRKCAVFSRSSDVTLFGYRTVRIVTHRKRDTRRADERISLSFSCDARATSIDTSQKRSRLCAQAERTPQNLSRESPLFELPALAAGKEGGKRVTRISRRVSASKATARDVGVR